MSEKHEYYIKGYKVTHTVPYSAVVKKGIKLPLYKKREKSDVIYCAGFYCVKYEMGWKCSDHVMLDTIQTYEYKGPFHSEEEAKQALQSLKCD